MKKEESRVLHLFLGFGKARCLCVTFCQWYLIPPKQLRNLEAKNKQSDSATINTPFC